MEKNEIRQLIKEKRTKMSKTEVLEKSRIIHQKLLTIEEFLSATTVMVYLSAFNEVDTTEIVQVLLASAKRVVIPVSDTSTETIIPSYITSMDELQKGAYGILEPISIRKAQIADIDCILVPGIAFDMQRNRMGFGKGYYDKLLCLSDAAKIGLCYDFQLQKNISTEEHDIPMDLIVTEERILRG